MTANENQSVTEWIAQAKRGDAASQYDLCNRYFEKLVRALEHRVPAGIREQTEDIALSAIRAFMNGVTNPENKCNEVQNREDLRRLLIHIAKNKAKNKRKGEKKGAASAA